MEIVPMAGNQEEAEVEESEPPSPIAMIFLSTMIWIVSNIIKYTVRVLSEPAPKAPACSTLLELVLYDASLLIIPLLHTWIRSSSIKNSFFISASISSSIYEYLSMVGVLFISLYAIQYRDSVPLCKNGSSFASFQGIILLLVSSASEELVFRGWLFRSLNFNIPIAPSTIIASLISAIFNANHLSEKLMIDSAIFSIWQLMDIQQESTLPSILCHFVDSVLRNILPELIPSISLLSKWVYAAFLVVGGAIFSFSLYKNSQVEPNN